MTTDEKVGQLFIWFALCEIILIYVDSPMPELELWVKATIAMITFGIGIYHFFKLGKEGGGGMKEEKFDGVYDREQAARIKMVEEILASYDIQMNIGGCGCCGSPKVTFVHKGRVIIDDESVIRFSMIS